MVRTTWSCWADIVFLTTQLKHDPHSAVLSLFLSLLDVVCETCEDSFRLWSHENKVNKFQNRRDLVHHSVIFDESKKQETVKQIQAFQLKFLLNNHDFLLQLDKKCKKTGVGQRIRIWDFEQFVQAMIFRVLISPIQTIFVICFGNGSVTLIIPNAVNLFTWL